MNPRKKTITQRMAIGLLSTLMVFSNILPVLASEVEPTIPKEVKVESEVLTEEFFLEPSQESQVLEAEASDEAQSDEVMLEAETVDTVEPSQVSKENLSNPPKEEAPKYQIKLVGESAEVKILEGNNPAKAGERVSIEVTAPSGYVIQGVDLKDEDGQLIQSVQGSHLDFQMPAQEVTIYSRGQKADIATDWNLLGHTGFRAPLYTSQQVEAWIGRVIQGTASIGGSTTHPTNGSWFDVSSLEEIGYVGSTSKHNQSHDGNAIWCRNAGAATPKNVQASFTARCVAIEGGYAYWDILITPPGATGTNNLDQPWNGFLSGYQRIGNPRFRVPIEESARFKIQKVSANPALTNGNGNYSLIGTQFWLVNSRTNQKLDRITVKDESGYLYSSGGSKDFILPTLSNGQKGVYHLEEIVAGKGYRLRSDKIPLNLEKTTELVKVSNEPSQPSKGKIELYKTSSNPTISGAYPEKYTLAGAIYGIYQVSNDQEVATMMTNEAGYAISKELDKGIYYVLEKTAPAGYYLDTRRHRVVVDDNVLATVDKKVSLQVTEIPKNDPIFLAVRKVDKETEKEVPTGKGSLAGAEFTVSYYPTLGEIAGMQPQRTWVLRTNEDGNARLLNEDKVRGDEFFIERGKITIPYGTITIQETKAPAGYLIDDKIHQIKIENIGEAEGITTYNPPIIKEQVIRGGLEIRKTGDSLISEAIVPLKDVEFTIISKTTGQEVMKIVTDAQGIAKTKDNALAYDDYLVRETKTPKGYIAVDDFEVSITKDKAVLQISKHNQAMVGSVELLKKEMGSQNVLAGARFSLTKDGKEVASGETNEQGMIRFDNLKYGTGYQLQEVKAPEGYFLPDEELRTFTFDITKDKEVFHYILENEKKPEIQTEATIEGEKIVYPQDKLTLTDKVSYQDLIVGKEYTLTATVMDKLTNAPLVIDGEIITLTKTFVPTEPSGVEEISITIDGMAVAGKEVVYFETLSREGREVAIHTDINDPGQTVKIEDPSIGTTATVNGAKEVKEGKAVTLVDTIHYKNFIPGKKAIFEGKVMDKSTGKVLVIDGKEVSAKKEVMIEKSSGSVDVSFTFNAKGLGGKELVVFERVYDMKGNLIQSHEDMEDEGQTVKITKTIGKITIGKPKKSAPKTGDSDLGVFMGMSLMVSMVVFTYFSLKRKETNQ